MAQSSSMYANSECFAANRPKTKTVIYSDVQHMIESNHFPYYRHYVFLGPGSKIQEGGMNKYARFAKAEVWLKEQQSIWPVRESITQPLDCYHSITTTYTTVAFMLSTVTLTTNKKHQCYPLWFFSWRPKKNDNVTPHVSFDKNDSVTPYDLIDKYWQCYPSCFFSWRLIKNDSVTPYIFFHDDQ